MISDLPVGSHGRPCACRSGRGAPQELRYVGAWSGLAGGSWG